MTMTKLLSIILASIHKDKLSGLFANLETTARDMDSFEVLIKLDDENPEMVAYLETEKRQRPFSIKYIVTPRLRGYWDLYLAYNELWKMSSPETYFATLINDNARFATQHWDDILRRYVGYFSDDIFHLRTSKRKRLEFRSLVECLTYGESYAFFTQKWLSLTEGIGVGEAEMDAGQECVNYFLRTKCGYSRGVVVDAIKMANEEAALSASHGLSGKEWHKKLWGIYGLYAKLLTRDKVENFYRLARKLSAYIWASENDLPQFEIEDGKADKKILVKINSQSDPVKSFPYEVDFLTWLSVLFDIEPVGIRLNWDRWPPLLANQIIARRQLAQLWLSMPPEQVENAYLGDLGKAHKKLLNISIRNKPLTTARQLYINKLVKYIASEYSELDESAFVDDLVGRILNGPGEKSSVQDLLAALLYCRDDELLYPGFDLSSIPKWLRDDLSPSVFRKAKIERTKQRLLKFIPHPVLRKVLRTIQSILIKIKNLIEEILEG